jgi:hypothetical protein
VAGQTKLYQRAGSPLIMGHSRFERSPWVEWFVASLAAVVGLLAVHAIATLLDPERPYLGSFADVASWLYDVAPGIVASVVVAGIAVWFGHRSGWRRAWVAAGLIGAAGGVAVMLVLKGTL